MRRRDALGTDCAPPVSISPLRSKAGGGAGWPLRGRRKERWAGVRASHRSPATIRMAAPTTRRPIASLLPRTTADGATAQSDYVALSRATTVTPPAVERREERSVRAGEADRKKGEGRAPKSVAEDGVSRRDGEAESQRQRRPASETVSRRAATRTKTASAEQRTGQSLREGTFPSISKSDRWETPAMRVAVVGYVEWAEFARVERVPRPARS